MGEYMKSISLVLFAAIILGFYPLLMADKVDEVTSSNESYTICLAAGNHGYFQTTTSAFLPIKNPKCQINTVLLSSPRYKSKATATILAIVPGFFIHGIGHFYSGDMTTGLILLSAEIISVGGMFLIGLKDAFGERWPKEDKNYNFYYAIGAFTFFVSWMYDILHSPMAVEKYNLKIRAGIQIEDADKIQINVCLNF
jgi:TM2 domain-containing membrane protein YozV